jgi:predicted permease
MDHVGQDLRYAARRLTRAPAFALSAVLILIVGIGLNLAFFQLLNVTALRPLRVADLDTLVRFDRVTKRFSSNGIPYPATQFIRQHNAVLSAVVTSTASDVVWGDDLNHRLDALYVSANWFAELGYGAALGRIFVAAQDERSDAAPVIVVSYDFWRTHLQSEAVVGRIVRVNDRQATIIGVAPEGFPGLRLGDVKVWLLIDQIDYFNAGMAFKEDWSGFNTQLYGRLRPGISPAAARDGLQATVRELARVRPDEFQPDESLQPSSGRDYFRGARDRAKLRATALIVGGLMLIVLLVACANLSNLVLSHAIGRLREFSVRSALGATRWRVLRQQLVECAVIASAGALGGLIAGYWCAKFVAVQTSLPGYVDLTPDWRMVLAAGLIASMATLVIGVVPAWMVSRRDLVAAMKDGGHQTSRGLSRGRFRLVLIASQVAGCCILLIVAGSMVRGLQRILGPELGFQFAQVAVLDASLSRYGIAGEAARAFWTDVKDRISALPDVVSLALASHPPVAESANRSIYNDAPRLSVTHTVVEPSFFPLLRIAIVAGRNFDASDQAGQTVIVSRRLAVEMYGTVNAVGKGFPRSKPAWTIVGVAGDAPLVNIAATNVAELYSPVRRGDYARLVLLVRARNDPERLLIPIGRTARQADSRVLPRTWLAAARFEETLHGRRVASRVAGFAGLLALALACFGISGLVAQSVSMRMKEIGIRRALGADGGRVVRLLIRQLILPVAAGTLVGTFAGVLVGRALEAEPFYLPATNAAMPAAAVVLLTISAIVAALVPAARALDTDPLQALRHE